MPYKRHKPVSEEEMELIEPVPLSEMGVHRWDGHHTVCQTIREIYRMTEDPEIKMKCRLAMAMTKAMHEAIKRLKQEKEELNGNLVK